MYKVLLNKVFCLSFIGFSPLCFAMKETPSFKPFSMSHVVASARNVWERCTTRNSTRNNKLPSKELNFSLIPQESIFSLVPPEIIIKICDYLVPNVHSKGEVDIVISLENLTHFACVNQTLYGILYHERYLYSRLKDFVTRDAQTLTQSCKEFTEKYPASAQPRELSLVEKIIKKKSSSDAQRAQLLPIFQELVKEIFELNAKNEEFKRLLFSHEFTKVSIYLKKGFALKLVDFSDTKPFFLSKRFANDQEWLIYHVVKNTLRELVEKGLDPNTLFLNAEGTQCPLLYFAVDYFNSDKDLIELLLKHGANPELVV